MIGITGGSVACFFAINGTKRLEEALAQDPRFAGKQFVFVNLALPGYKQPQQLMTLAYLLSLGAEFDMIVNIDGFNEVALDEFENSEKYLFPAFPRLWQARIVVSDMNLGFNRIKLLLINAERAELARQFSRPPWGYSPLGNLIWLLLDRRLDHQVTRVLDSYRSPERAGLPRSATGPRREFATAGDRYEFLAQTWASSSLQMNGLCRARGTRYYHFLQPNQYVAGSKPILDAEKRIAIFEGHPYSQGVDAATLFCYGRARRSSRKASRTTTSRNSSPAIRNRSTSTTAATSIRPAMRSWRKRSPDTSVKIGRPRPIDPRVD